MRGTDNAGVRSLAIEAGGQTVATRTLPCDDYAMKPCPDDVWLDSSFDTTRLPDGRVDRSSSAPSTPAGRPSRTVRP